MESSQSSSGLSSISRSFSNAHRSKKPRSMRNSGRDVSGEWWLLRADQSKNKLDNQIYLTELTRSLMPAMKNEGPYIFSSKGTVPMVLGDKIKRKINKVIDIPHWKFHHFGHAFMTHLNELGCSPHIVSACIGHLSAARTGISGVYNHSDYKAQKRAVFQRWSDLVREVVDGR